MMSDMADGVLLVVDDNELMRETLSDILSDAGYEVATADNGRQALDVLNTASVRIVFMDLMMPVMNGWELFDAMKGTPTLTDIPVCVITTSPNDGPRGSVCTLHLPFALDRLLSIVRDHALPGG
jgi:CheY-like chemotaxis protein